MGRVKVRVRVRVGLGLGLGLLDVQAGDAVQVRLGQPGEQQPRLLVGR